MVSPFLFGYKSPKIYKKSPNTLGKIINKKQVQKKLNSTTISGVLRQKISKKILPSINWNYYC